MKVTCWKVNGVWFATRKDHIYSRHNPLGRGCNASAAYNDYVNQII